MKCLSLLFALALSGCTKVDVYPPQTQTQAGPPVLTPGSQSAQDRIVEIDRLLSAPLTGQRNDADQRATLRAERAALAGTTNGYQNPSVVVHNSVNVRTNPPQQLSRQLMQQQQVPMVTVARDSAAEEKGNLRGVEGMLPSERERYFKELRIRNPQPIVAPVYYDRERRR